MLCFVDKSLSLGLNNGLLIAVPIPSAHSTEGSQIEAAIQQAILEAK